MRAITGSTRVFYCIADPVAQVRAPEIFNAVFEKYDVDAVMVPMRVDAEGLAPTLRSLFASPSVGGIALSIPHKHAAVSIVDACSIRATTAQAINAVRRDASGKLEGDLFDGIGFIGLLQRAKIVFLGRRVLVIGAGGAASALGTALAEEGVGAIAFYDPMEDRAARVVENLRRHFACESRVAASSDPRGFDVVINASPLGLQAHDPLPFDVDAVDDGAAVCDILMKNQPTRLVLRARERGLQAEPGFDMLVRQTPFYLSFFGYRAIAQKVLEEDLYLKELIAESIRVVEPAI